MVAMERVQLSEQQWSAIAKAGGLPESARESIEWLIGYYQAFQQASAIQPRAAHTRNELLRIAKLAEMLVSAIFGVKPDARPAGVQPHVLAALMLPVSLPTVGADGITAVTLPRRPGSSTPMHDAFTLLYERVLTVEQLRLWFEKAARLLPADTTGAHKAAENHRWLVGQLDGILAECTGRHVSRSYKDDDLQRFVELCFTAADPNVGGGSIKKAIEAYVRFNPRHRTARALITKKNALKSGH
jgi:hypothetical protein